MDYLQIALIFLIILLAVFLTITGIQVFLILRDLKKALDKLNHVLETGEEIAQDIGRPVAVASQLVSSLATGAKALTDGMRKDPHGSTNHSSTNKPKQKRFYKKFL